MSVREAEETPAWTIAEAKAKLSEILRLAESEGPQRIGMRKRYVVVPEEVWLEREPPPQAPEEVSPEGEPPLDLPLGQWLVENLRGLGPLNVPDRKEGASHRPIPYADWTEEDWAAFDATDPENQ